MYYNATVFISLSLSSIMSFTISSLSKTFTKRISFFNLKLWIVIVICISLLSLLLILFTSLYFIYCRRKKPYDHKIYFNKSNSNQNYSVSSMDRRLLSRNGSEMEMRIGGTPQKVVVWSNNNDAVDLEIGGWPWAAAVVDRRQSRHQYSLREIAIATNGLAGENVIGSGDYGVVYRGVLLDGTRVAVKKLAYDRCEPEDLIIEAEAVRCLRHRNLARLLGYCTEGAYRMLVYEYVDNGNLQQWLHERFEQVSPLTWDIRMNIIHGVAKGLAYLHEDVEPLIVHERMKSSNILLDRQWNPKISDLGIPNKISADDFNDHDFDHDIEVPFAGMAGCVAPECAAKYDLSPKNDTFSFGVLIMEIISGRPPVDFTQPEEEKILINLMKSMVANKDFDSVVDPKLPEMPSLKDLKRILLIALRCVDEDVENRPKMGDVINMLEPHDLLLSDVVVIRTVSSQE